MRQLHMQLQNFSESELEQGWAAFTSEAPDILGE